MVKEEEQPGTIVIKVNAKDQDPPEEGGIYIQSEIFSLNLYFY